MDRQDVASGAKAWLRSGSVASVNTAHGQLKYWPFGLDKINRTATTCGAAAEPRLPRERILFAKTTSAMARPSRW